MKSRDNGGENEGSPVMTMRRFGLLCFAFLHPIPARRGGWHVRRLQRRWREVQHPVPPKRCRMLCRKRCRESIPIPIAIPTAKDAASVFRWGGDSIRRRDDGFEPFVNLAGQAGGTLLTYTHVPRPDQIGTRPRPAVGRAGVASFRWPIVFFIHRRPADDLR